MTTAHFHSCGFAVPQINTVPSIRWETLNANHKPEPAYLGHLPDGSSVQKHSADDAYAKHGIVMEAHESIGICGPRRLWLAKKGERVIAAHPRHDAARFMALALLVGA